MSVSFEFLYLLEKLSLLKLFLRFNGSNSQKMKELLSDYSTISQLAYMRDVVHRRNSSTINFSSTKTEATSSSLFPWKRGDSLRINRDHSPSTPDSANKSNYLTVEQLQNFLQKSQQMKTVSIEDCAKLITLFEPSLEGRQSEQLGVDGLRMLLLHDEFCIMNANKSRRVYQDMTRPITDYFIATSHNT